MVFKRRKKLSYGRWIAEAFFPRAGWKRAASYVWHRVRRLPDTPHKIARGVGIGVFVSFTPFFGLHFVLAAALALVVRGNVIASILATFFGNPLSFPLIAWLSLKIGGFLLGVGFKGGEHNSIVSLFARAFGELWRNFTALFGGANVDWSNLQNFFMQVFLPYLVGGLMPGLIAAVACYFLTLPVITAYQNRRRGKLMARWKERKAKQGDSSQ